jgi:hypothetical protein
MMITIERPKTVDLEEMFNLRLKIALASDGVEITKRIPIKFGQTKVDFMIEATTTINQAIIYKNNGEVFWHMWVDPQCSASRGWTATLTINWSNL